MESIYHSLIHRLEENSRLNASKDDFRKRYADAIPIIDSIKIELDVYLKEHSLDHDESRHVSKYVKPEIESYKIEEEILYRIMMAMPIGTNELKATYLEEEITALRITLRRHGFYYHYYKEGLTELDSVFFSDGSNGFMAEHNGQPEAKGSYLSSIGYLFALFKSAERLQITLQNEIFKFKNDQIFTNSSGADIPSEFKWTGDVINIVEVAYGLWLTGQLNHGHAKLDQIVRWLERILQVKIGKVRNRFAEIERRKKLNTTRFLDEMKESILKKIENSNA